MNHGREYRTDLRLMTLRDHVPRTWLSVTLRGKLTQPLEGSSADPVGELADKLLTLPRGVRCLNRLQYVRQGALRP